MVFDPNVIMVEIDKEFDGFVSDVIVGKIDKN